MTLFIFRNVFFIDSFMSVKTSVLFVKLRAKVEEKTRTKMSCRITVNLKCLFFYQRKP